MDDGSRFRIGGWTVTPGLNLLEHTSGSVKIESRPMDVLVCLANRAPEAVSVEELVREVWNGRVVSDNSIYLVISQLRNVLGEAAPNAIETIPKRGYRLAVPVLFLPARSSFRERSKFQSALPARRHLAATLAVTVVLIATAAIYVSSWSPLSPDVQPEPPTIAVLPFVNLSGEEGDDYLGEGIAEEIIHALSNGSGLRVIARTSSFSFQDTTADIQEISERLGATVVLEGSVRSENGRVRIISQLIDTRDSSHLWSDDFDRPLEDLITMEREIAIAVAQRLMGETADMARIAAALPSLEAIDAYEYYLLGRQRMRNPYQKARFWPGSDANRAIEYFRRAIAVDPGFARAYAGLAEALLRRTRIGNVPGPIEVPQEVGEEALAAIDQALALDPQLAEAHTSRGWALRLLDRDDERAMDAFRQAIALNPNLPDPHVELGRLLRHDAPEESLTEHQAAQQLDPMAVETYLRIGYRLHELERYEEAEAAYRTVLQLFPESAEAYQGLGETMELLGKHGEAALYYERALSFEHAHPIVFVEVARNKWSLGRPDEAIRLLLPLLGNPEYERREAHTRTELAYHYIELGDYQTAEAVLEPIEQTDRAANVRVHLALAQGRYEDAANIVHEWESNVLAALYEMVIGHDDHARDRFDEIAAESGPLAGTEYFQWGYYPAVNAAHLYLRAGDTETVAATLEESRRALNPALEDQYLEGGAYYLLASISAIEGKTDEALDMLEEAIASGWTRHWFAPRDPNLESLWAEPRFQALISGVKAEMDRLRLEMQRLVALE